MDATTEADEEASEFPDDTGLRGLEVTYEHVDGETCSATVVGTRQHVHDGREHVRVLLDTERYDELVNTGSDRVET